MYRNELSNFSELIFDARSIQLSTLRQSLSCVGDDFSKTVFWMTGLSGAGKTTVAMATARLLTTMGHATQVFDGDALRQTLSKDLGFSNRERAEHITRVASVVKAVASVGTICLCPLITPLEEHRAIVRTLLPKANIVYVACPLSICEERDVKGLYEKVRSGTIQGYTGVSAPFDEPITSDCIIKTKNECIGDSTQHFLNFILQCIAGKENKVVS